MLMRGCEIGSAKFLTGNLGAKSLNNTQHCFALIVSFFKVAYVSRYTCDIVESLHLCCAIFCRSIERNRVFIMIERFLSLSPPFVYMTNAVERISLCARIGCGLT